MLAIPPPVDAPQSDAEMPSKQLFVLRHAKSSWDNPGLDDYERPLSPRGRRAAELLGAYVRENGIHPELVLCSSARRTRETLEGVAPGGEVSIEDELYGASTSSLIERLHGVADGIESVMLIGHNPALQMLVLRLTEGRIAATDGYLADVERKFPTGALATLEFEGPWRELEAGSGGADRLREAEVPRLSARGRLNPGPAAHSARPSAHPPPARLLTLRPPGGSPSARPAAHPTWACIRASNSSAPPLDSGSLRLPHFGDCTHDGQPSLQRHSPIRRRASPTSRSN